MKLKILTSTPIRIAISLVLIMLIIVTRDVNKIKDKLLSSDIRFFLIALFFLLLGTIFSSLRWKEILKATNKEIGLFKLFSLYLKGYFYNNFLPTQMGGDVYKALSLSKSIGDKHIAIFSVFVDRFAGLIVLVLLGVYGLSFKIGGLYSVLLVLATLIGFTLYLPLLSYCSKRFKFLSKFYDASVLLVKNKKSGLLIIFYSVLVQLASFSMSYFLFRSVGIYLTLKDILAYMPLASLSLLLPSFNGWGIQEWVYSGLYGNSGYLSENTIAVSFLTQGIRIIMSLIGGIFILLNLGRIKKDSHENS